MGAALRRRAVRLAIALVCLGIALAALLVAISMVGTARSLAAPERAFAPYDAVSSGRVTYAPRPSMPPTCAPVHPAKGCVYVLNSLQYAVVDYPLQVAVNASNTVTLTLSVREGGLSLGPSRGTLAAAPIALPADVSQYRDIAVVAQAIQAPNVSAANNPIVWQMTQPAIQSLLATHGTTRAYRNVSFNWKVTALSAGADVTSIAIQVVEEGWDGSQSLGPQELTDSPIPIIAVAPPSVGGAIGLVVLALGSLGAAVTLLLDTVGRVHDALQIFGALRVTKNAHTKARELIKQRRDRRASPSAAPDSAADPPPDHARETAHAPRGSRPSLRSRLQTHLRSRMPPPAPSHHRVAHTTPRHQEPPHPQ